MTQAKGLLSISAEGPQGQMHEANVGTLLQARGGGTSAHHAQQGWLRGPGQRETLLLNSCRLYGWRWPMLQEGTKDSGRARKGREEISPLLGALPAL